jgi:hypothetical protein
VTDAVSDASSGTELVRARELFDAGEFGRSAQLLLSLTDAAPNAESLERVEAEIRRLRQHLVDQAETTNTRSARDDLARFDQGLGDSPMPITVPDRPGGNAGHVLLIVATSIAGAVGGAFIGVATCHEEAEPVPEDCSFICVSGDIFPCAGALTLGLLIGLGAGIAFGLLTVWSLRKRRANRRNSSGSEQQR